MANQKYYLYVDDSGQRYPDKEPKPRDDGMDYFALGGILVKDSDRSPIITRYEEFCRSWDIHYPLHSSDIRGRRGDFSWLKDEVVNKKFNIELMEFLKSIPVIGYAVVIDRPGYNKRYEEKYKEKRWWMCKTAFAILVERVSKYMKDEGYRFKIIFENCGVREENAIVQYFRDLRKYGTPFDHQASANYGGGNKDLFNQVPYGDPERQTKKNPLLQIADLYLYPMVKGGYDKTYFPYVFFLENKKLIDAILPPEKLPTHGIKYSCFDS